MKRKFACLSRGLAYQPDSVCNIIKACAFLWNWGIITGDNKGYHPDDYVIDEEDQYDDALADTHGGQLRRNLLRDYLWNHK